MGDWVRGFQKSADTVIGQSDEWDGHGDVETVQGERRQGHEQMMGIKAIEGRARMSFWEKIYGQPLMKRINSHLVAVERYLHPPSTRQAG